MEQAKVETARVVVDVADHLATVTLNRPEKLNAMDWATFDALHAAAAQVREEAAAGQVRAVLLTGAGRAFSAGLDVALFGQQAAGETPDDAHIAQLQQAFTGFEDLPVPVLAAVRGATFGAGAQLALAAHMRIAADDLSFGLLEARWGLIPDLGATWRLPRLVGLGRATDMCARGRRLDAATALAWGLVEDVVPADDLAAEAHARALALASAPPLAAGALPGLLRDALGGDRDRALAAERAAQQRCLVSADFRTAVRAAVSGTPPVFEGR